jgi:hypothetical protein
LKGKTNRSKPSQPAEIPAASPSPKIVMLEKRLASEKRKLESAIKAGKPEKPIKDRIYEIEDELRLAKA